MFAWQAELIPGVRGAFTSTEAGNLAFHVGNDAEAVREHRCSTCPRSMARMWPWSTP